MEFYIDSRDKAINKALFDGLLKQRVEIEHSFGGSLSWERLEDRRASRIATYRQGSITDGPERLQDLTVWAAKELLKLRAALAEPVAKINATLGNNQSE